jgi:hypothetical protein
MPTQSQLSYLHTFSCKAGTMSARAHIKYLVEKYHGYWTVMFSGKRHGKFSSHGEACHSALQDGIRVGHLGHEVEIEAREQSGDTRTVWTSESKT